MKQTVFDKLDKKYGQPEPDHVVDNVQKDDVPTVPSELKSWKDSDAVKKLSAFMKQYHDQGFFMQQTRDGSPVLFFYPGLESKEKDPDRWELAEHAAYLKALAFEDLKTLISAGELSFPVQT